MLFFYCILYDLNIKTFHFWKYTHTFYILSLSLLAEIKTWLHWKVQFINFIEYSLVATICLIWQNIYTSKDQWVQYTNIFIYTYFYYSKGELRFRRNLHTSMAINKSLYCYKQVMSPEYDGCLEQSWVWMPCCVDKRYWAALWLI